MSNPAPTYDVDFLRRIEDTTLNDKDLARNAQILNDFKASDSEIKTFFKERCILITGATGFVGKVLLEKMLRTCSELKGVFILVRPSEKKSMEKKLDEFFNQTIFDILRKKQPNFRKKIIAIKADLEQEKLGISDEDIAKIQQCVSVFFHAAATVRFYDPIRKTVLTNIRGTGELIKIALGCPMLASFVHFSTAYANSYRDTIDEEFYRPPVSPIDLIDLVMNTDDQTLKDMTPKILGKYQNTYVMSKSATEELVRQMGSKIPICIFRPSIIVSTYREPVRGWGDNIFGASGIMVGAGIGFIHAFHCDKEKKTDLVPVDMVANASIACAWRTAQEGIRTQEPLIYNYVSSVQNPITWEEWTNINAEASLNYPTVKAIWYYSFLLIKNWHLYKFCVIFLHFIPAYIMDGICKLRGEEQRLVKAYDKMEGLITALKPFTTNDWKFTNNNVQNLWTDLNEADKYLFHFNMAECDWLRFAETYLLGLRVYLVKDPVSTLPEARKKWKKLKYLHYTIKYSVLFLVVWFVWFLLSKIFL